MTTKQLKAVATGVPTAPTKPKTIAGLLTDPSVKQQMALALPKHMTADRLARVALTEIRKNPALAKCDQTSFLGSIMQCAQLGLEPGGALGHAYLIPFENRRKQITEVQFIVGYRGMIDLARRSGQIVSLTARSAFEKDHFSYRYGLDETVEHIPHAGADRGELTYVYAVAKLKDGGVQFEVMSRAEIEEVRNASQGYKTAVRYDRTDSPWIAHFEEMAKKTVIRRLFKYLPVSIELQRAVGLDEQVDLGISQDNPLTFDTETGEVLDDAPEHSSTSAQAHETSGPATPPEAPASNGQQPPLGQRIRAQLEKCNDIDVLDVIADEIRELADKAEADDLTTIWKKRRAELAAQA